VFYYLLICHFAASFNQHTQGRTPGIMWWCPVKWWWFFGE